MIAVILTICQSPEEQLEMESHLQDQSYLSCHLKIKKPHLFEGASVLTLL